MKKWILKKLNLCCFNKKPIHVVYKIYKNIKTEYGHKDIQFWAIKCKNCGKIHREGEAEIKSYTGKISKVTA